MNQNLIHIKSDTEIAKLYSTSLQLDVVHSLYMYIDHDQLMGVIILMPVNIIIYTHNYI